jgi:hypothetical protein
MYYSMRHAVNTVVVKIEKCKNLGTANSSTSKVSSGPKNGKM